MIDISSYNKVLSYLPSSRINIYYLNGFEEDDINCISSSNPHVTPFVTKGLEHDRAFGLNGVSDFIIDFNTDVKEVRLDNFEKVEFTVASTADFDFEEILQRKHRGLQDF